MRSSVCAWVRARECESRTLTRELEYKKEKDRIRA